MKIEINYKPKENNYHYKVWTGPDGIDHTQGYESSLSQCFEKILEFRLMNALTYTENLNSTLGAYFQSLDESSQ